MFYLSGLPIKRAVVNPINEGDEGCFMWAVIAALHYREIGNHPERISKLKPYVGRYNWDGLVFPVTLQDICGFEKNNEDIAINVLYVEDKNIEILRKSEYHDRENIVNLLMVSDGKKKHYTTIKNLSRLLSSENTRGNGREYYCMNCLQGFYCINVSRICNF